MNIICMSPRENIKSSAEPNVTSVATGRPLLGVFIKERIMEEWRDVTGWEGLYEVSNIGRARSLDRVTQNGGGPYIKKGRMLNPFLSAKYYYVVLTIRGKPTIRPVHQLVLESFVSPRPEGAVTRHLNGNPSDNRVSNLAWGTCRDNTRDSIRHGTHAHGEKSVKSKLTDEDVREIRRRREVRGEELLPIALSFGVSKACIHNIAKRKSWKHLI